MHLSLFLLTSLAVFFHLGTNIAGQLLKDNTDRKKIEAINARVDQIFGVVSALAPALPTAVPKTAGQVLADAAAVADALAPSVPDNGGGKTNAS